VAVTLAAFAVVLAVTPIAAAVGARAGLVDAPGPLKVHDRPVAFLGGAAVFAGVAPFVAAADAALLLPLGLAFALGLADDVAGIPPVPRLACEAGIAAVAAAVLGVHGPVGVLATAATVVLLLNAVNLLDGLDGLAAGVALAGAAGFAIVLGGDDRVPAAALAGGLAGFAVWNRPPARIFLGDSGSYLVGAALAMLLATTFTQEPAPVATGALLFVAVPVADTTIAVVRRARARRPLLAGDRGHVYDQLVDRGIAPARVVALTCGAQALLTAAGLVAGTWSTGPAVAAVGAVVAVTAAATLRAFTAPAGR
jgi:UDP-GlcNAc:undecaprenyl-phosphate GlcNAc-1-phosphate transferase